MIGFGTGGIRGHVGTGPDDFSPDALAAAVQGHCLWLRDRFERPSVAIAYDVRVCPSGPLIGWTSADFARHAARVYRGNGVRVHLGSRCMATPELSFAVTELGCSAGLVISASHNPPTDNGAKFYTETGAQICPPDDEDLGFHQPVFGAEDVELFDLSDAYVEHVVDLSRDDARDAVIVFTGLHGTGTRTVPKVLRAAGFTVHEVPEQADEDGAFSTVASPNPEVASSLDRARQLAQEVGADLVLGTDPDADRIGAATVARVFTGQEIAAVCVDHVLASGGHRVVTTLPTSRLVSRIGAHYGAMVVDRLLVGFKYIARYPLDIGVEESHGVLISPRIRDKDAAQGALLLAEVASLAKQRGETLQDVVDGLQARHGPLFHGAWSRRGRHVLRGRVPPRLGGTPVVSVDDHLDETWGPMTSASERRARDLLVLHLDGGGRVIFRPSGTEPKVKAYLEMPSAEGLAAVSAGLDALFPAPGNHEQHG